MFNLGGMIKGSIVVALGAVGFIACSAGEGYEGTQEGIDSVEQAIGLSCAANAPSKIVTGGFDPAYVALAPYSDCYKGNIVQINNYSSKFAVGGHTKVGWGGPRPSNADCTSSSVGAYLFEQQNGQWVHVISKGAYGDDVMDGVDSTIVLPPKQPRLPGAETVQRQAAVSASTSTLTTFPKDPTIVDPIKTPASTCRPPAVYFYGDEMKPGKNYLIVASARLPGKVLEDVSYTSVAGTCGQDAQYCCWSGTDCDSGLTCNGDMCDTCGARGELCCDGGTCDRSDLKCGSSNTCIDCGGTGETCCAGSKCEGTNTCQSGVCKAPPTPQPDPQPVACGKSLQACCTTSPACSGTGLYGGPLSCVDTLAGKVCSDNPPGNCNYPGEDCCVNKDTNGLDALYCASSFAGSKLRCGGVTCTTN